MKAWLYLGFLVLMLAGSLATAQRAPIVHPIQERLLALEAETPPFRHFDGVTIQEFHAMRSRGAVLPTDALVAAKEDASALRSLTLASMVEAGALSEGLYLAPGVELDAEMMYRYSAWELGRFFEMWDVVLAKVDEAETTSPSSYWEFKEIERANEAYETARVYRILANQQYLLEMARDNPSLE